MTLFLGMFSGYRDLCSAKTRLETESSMWRERAFEAERKLAEVTDRLIANTEKTADVLSMQALGRRLFSKAEVSNAPVATQISNGPLFARGAKMQQTARAMENFKHFFEGQLKDTPNA